MLFYEVRGVEMEEVSCTVTEEVKSRIDFGTCTWRYALLDGVKTDILDAPRGSHGICPSCGDELISRQGEMNTWHWAHKNGHVCDKWYEPKGAWHCWWQNQFDKAWQEVVIVKKGDDGQEIKHVADICTDEGWIIEFQYSSIRPEMIRAREAFYGKKMVWVVSGTSRWRDLEKRSQLFNLDFVQSKNGLFYAILPDGNAFNRRWRESERLVFLDYYGTFKEPASGINLLCLLPKFKDVEERVIVRISQEEFIEKFKQNKAESFVETFRSLFKEARVRCEELRKANAERLRIEEEQERIRLQCYQQTEEDVAREYEEKRRKTAEKRELEYQDILKRPVRYAITLGWIKAHALCANWNGAQIVQEAGCDHLPERCDIAIHFKNAYTREDYAAEIEWAKKHLKETEWQSLPSYDELKRQEGLIVGKSLYGRDLNGEITIAGCGCFCHYDSSVRRIPCIPDGKGIWALEGDYFDVVNDCKSRKILPCPKCGAPLRLRKNKSALTDFFGCSRYPQCKFTCNCDEEGHPSVVNPWERNQLKIKTSRCHQLLKRR